MSKLHDLCKDYDFCSPETRAELEANGFDFSVCKFGITSSFSDNIVIRTQTPSDQIYEAMCVVPYPTFTEVWRKLPAELHIDRRSHIKVMNDNMVMYARALDGNIGIVRDFKHGICEAACELWLELKKGGYLNA